MSVFDVDKLLAPVSPDAPCGENLEYDADYAAMEQAATGKPEQQFGKTTIAGEEPNWKEVRDKALSLLSRTKDLRVGLYLVRSTAWLDGLPGLADGVSVLTGLIEKYWEGVHPRLDPDDDNDPTLRMNTIAGLCDPMTTLRAMQIAPLVASRGLGKFSYRDIQIASGETPPPAGTAKVEQSTIDGAFAECEADELKSTGKALKQAVDCMKTLESEIVKQVGIGNAPPLDPFTDLLSAMNMVVQQKLAVRGLLDDEAPVAEPAYSSTEAAAGSDGNGQAASAAINGRRAGAAQALTGDISSRD